MKIECPNQILPFSFNHGQFIIGSGSFSSAENLKASCLQLKNENDASTLAYKIIRDTDESFFILKNDQSELILVTDFVGKSPLYYSFNEEGRIQFSFSLKQMALLQGNSNLDRQGLFNYFSLQYSPGPETLISGIKKVRPSCITRVTDNQGVLCIEQHSYFDAIKPDPNRELSTSEALKQALDDNYDRVIAEIGQSTTKIFAFCSGGVDSSKNIAHLTGKGVKLTALTAAYEGDEYDETDYARKVSGIVGVPHKVEQVSSHAIELIPEMVAKWDEPNGDRAALPTFSLLTSAAVTGNIIIVSGEGGDEIWGLPRRLNSQQYNEFSTLPAAKALEGYIDRVSCISRNDVTSIVGEDLRSSLEDSLWCLLGDMGFSTQGVDSAHLVKALQMRTWLPGNVLNKDISMAKAKDVLVVFPLVSRDLVKLMCTDGSDLGADELAVKSLLIDQLPAELAEMLRKQIKRRFLVPLENWIQESNAGVLSEWLEKIRALPVNADIFEKKFKEYKENPSERLGREIWVAMILGYWFDNLKAEMAVTERKIYMTSPLARIDITGHFSRSSVQAEWVEKPYPKNEDAIAEKWEKRIALAKQQGRDLYNSPLCSLETVKAENDRLKLLIGRTSYRDYSSYRVDPDLFDSGELPNPMGTQIIPVIDGKEIILAQRALNMDVNPGKWFTFGGFMEPEIDVDSKDGSPDIFLCAQREFEEETGIHLDVGRFELIGIVYDLVTPHPECVFVAHITAEQASTFAHEGDEYSKMRTMALANIKDFLAQESGNITSTTVAALNIIHQQGNDAQRAHSQNIRASGPTFV